jgi:Short C-terminal domain
VASNDGAQQMRPANAGSQDSVPAMPSVPPEQLFRGAPYTLLDFGARHSLGWQDDRKAGPSFVVVRLSRLGTPKVKERFPLTEQGWAKAWHRLCGLDTGAAAAIEARLARREAGSRARAALAALDAESLCCLPRVTFTGGSGGASLAKGQPYDVRLLGDRIMVCPQRSVNALIDVPYGDVETVEVSGPVGKSAGEMLAWISGFGLLGAVLGFLLIRPRPLSLLLGAAVFGLVSGLVAAGSTKAETIVRICGQEAELYFLYTGKRPDAVRIELSEPLLAIRNASAAQAGGSNETAELTSGSIPDQLDKLASLLGQGLITREEFELLKAKLIAKS